MAQNIGQQMAGAQAQLRKTLGPGVFELPIGTVRDATCRTLGLREAGEFLPEGGENAAYADALRITVNPDPAITRETEGDTCRYQGVGYEVLKVPPPEMAFGTAIAQPLIVYRPPQAGSATAETAAEATAAGRPQDAGKRKEY